MSRMLAALRRIESQQLLVPSQEQRTIADSNLRIDEPHSIPLPKSEFVATAFHSSGTAGCLSASAFWPSL